MGGSFPTDGPWDVSRDEHDEDRRDDPWEAPPWESHQPIELSLTEPRPVTVRVPPRHLFPQVPPAVELLHESARTESDPEKRPVYWRGIDWRRFFQHHASLRDALTPRAQLHNTCVGFAVAHVLRANVAITRGVDVGEVNPYFIWGLARAKSYGLRQSNLLYQGLAVVNNYGVPSGETPTFEEATKPRFAADVDRYALEWNSPETASIRKVQSTSRWDAGWAICPRGCTLMDLSSARSWSIAPATSGLRKIGPTSSTTPTWRTTASEPMRMAPTPW